jgi:hypothetical protein
MISRPASKAISSEASGRMITSLLFEPFELWWAEHEQPGLRERPLVSVKGKRVVHANVPALREGITPGLSLINAKLKTPNLAMTNSDVGQLQAHWTWLLEQLHAWSPWLAGSDIGRAWLIVSAAEAQQLPREFRAQAGSAIYREVALAAALTSEIGQLHSVAAGQEQAFLDELPVEQLRGLGLSGRIIQRLQHLGISRMGELRKWQDSQLRVVLGEQTPLLLPLLRGPWTGTLPLYRSERSLECSHAFPDGAVEPWQVEPAITRLAWHLSERLNGEAATRITVTAESGGLQLQHETIPKTPVARPEVLVRLLQRALGHTGALSLGIDRISVTLRGLAVRQVQPGLWPQRQAREQAIRAVSRRFPGALLSYQLLDPYSLARDQRYRLIQLDDGAIRNQGGNHDRDQGQQKVRQNAADTATGVPAGERSRPAAHTAA